METNPKARNPKIPDEENEQDLFHEIKKTTMEGTADSFFLPLISYLFFFSFMKLTRKPMPYASNLFVVI